MPTCETCDGKEFHLYDGFYYCNLCNTQSQEIFEEAVDEEQFYKGTSERRVTKRKINDTPSSIASSSFIKEKSSEQTSHELFTLVLKLQVEFLIEQGVDDRIRDILWKLWRNYLKEMEIAFCSDNLNWKPKLSFKPRVSEVRLFNRNFKRRALLSKQKKKKKKRSQNIDEAMEMDEESRYQSDLESLMSRADSELSYYTSDGEMNESNLSQLSDLEPPVKEPLKYSKRSNPKGRCYSKINRMTLQMTISFCYLSLCLLGNSNRYFSLSDILRWIREIHFPYYNLLSIISKQVKLSYESINALKVSVSSEKVVLPNFDLIIKNAKEIRKLLNIPEQNIGVDPKYLLHKYLLELNLPCSIEKYARNILKVRANKILMHKEIAAIISIIIVLKQLFKLDGKHEIKLSEVSKNNSSKKSDIEKQFLWSEWVEHTNKKVNLMKSKIFHYWLLNPNYISKDMTCEFLSLRSSFFNASGPKGNYEKTIKSKFEEIADFNVKSKFGPVVFPWQQYMKKLYPESSDDLLLHKDFTDHSIELYLSNEDDEYWTLDSKCRPKSINDVRNKVPSSFLWLINVCSLVTDIPEERIYSELNATEEVLYNGFKRENQKHEVNS